MPTEQRLITHFFANKNAILKNEKKLMYKSSRDYSNAKAYLKKHKSFYDAAATRQGYFYAASANFTEYHVYTTRDQVKVINHIEKHIPAGTRVATAKIDNDSALEHIAVEPLFRRQGIGITLMKFIKQCDPQLYAYGGVEYNSRYRLTNEGAALINACIQKGILKDEEILPNVPDSLEPYSPCCSYSR